MAALVVGMFAVFVSIDAIVGVRILMNTFSHDVEENEGELIVEHEKVAKEFNSRLP
jgi:hypothetical protein